MKVSHGLDSQSHEVFFDGIQMGPPIPVPCHARGWKWFVLVKTELGVLLLIMLISLAPAELAW